jgi:hypothetical protein
LVLRQVKRSSAIERSSGWITGGSAIGLSATGACGSLPVMPATVRRLLWIGQHQTGTPPGPAGSGRGSVAPVVCTCVSRNGSGAEGNADTSAGVPGKEKSRHTHPPLVPYGGAFRAGSLAGQSRHPVVSLPRERATAVVLGYRGMDLPKVLRLAHTQEKPRPGAVRGSEWPKAGG